MRAAPVARVRVAIRTAPLIVERRSVGTVRGAGRRSAAVHSCRGTATTIAAPPGDAHDRGMKAIPLLVALAFAGALGGTAQAARAPSAAYFKVELSANQGVTWHLNYTSRICGGVSFTKGQGDATLRLHSTEPQIVTARRVMSPAKVALIVGRGGGGIPITGNGARTGTQSGGFTEPPTSGAGRPPEPIPVDCGSRNYPRGSQVGLHFD